MPESKCSIFVEVAFTEICFTTFPFASINEIELIVPNCSMFLISKTYDTGFGKTTLDFIFSSLSQVKSARVYAEVSVQLLTVMSTA